MSVRVRMFAALREAAGEDETVLDPGPLPQLLDVLRARYGELFTTRLRLCSVLIDGTSVPRDAVVDVPAGAELALLPPVSGGSGHARWRRPGETALPTGSPLAMPWSRAAIPVLLCVVGLGVLMAGWAPFAVLVVVVAAVVLLDLAGLLGRAGARPVMLGAVGPGFALPVAMALRPDIGLGLVPAFVTGMVLLACCLVLVFGRRAGATAGLGATAVAGLLVGTGASGLLLLRGTPDGLGFRWVLGLATLVAVADLATLGLRRWFVVPAVWLELSVPLVAVTPAAVGVWRVLAEPFELVTAMRFALIGLVASVCGTRLEHSLGFEAGLQRTGGPVRLGEGRVLASVDALLLAAPAAYLLARAIVR